MNTKYYLRRNFLLRVFFVLCLILLAYILIGTYGKSSNESSSEMKKIILPEVNYDSGVSLEQTLLNRRSIRRYRKDSIPLKEVAQLLWAAQGITSKGNKRTAPSAGALYPLQVYLVSVRINQLPVGVYKYIPEDHVLLVILEEDQQKELWSAASMQASFRNSSAIVVFTGNYKKTTGKYGERGNRYVHMEVGHAAQNVYLQAVSLNLGTVFIGAFNDEQVKEVLNIPVEEEVLGIMPVGKKE